MKNLGRRSHAQQAVRISIWLGLFALSCLILLAVFPVSPFKDRIARHIGSRLAAEVSIGSMERRELFSFTPTIIIRDLRIGQPRWAGNGDMVQARSIEIRISTLSLGTGGGGRPDSAVARGLSLARRTEITSKTSPPSLHTRRSQPRVTRRHNSQIEVMSDLPVSGVENLPRARARVRAPARARVLYIPTPDRPPLRLLC